MVETTDLLFAVDSIPAIFAITADPFLVFASNAFAILGLRSLYFVLAGALTTLKYLKVSLAVVLALVGAKMIAHTWLKPLLGEHFHLYVLGAVVLILAAGTIASLVSLRNASSDLGLHHVTATVDDAQADLDYCTDLLGLRLVKKTVNFDNHHVYHFYYGTERGVPGTIWTTFPYRGTACVWARRARGRWGRRPFLCRRRLWRSGSEG
jgi:hypothetical protein